MKENAKIAYCGLYCPMCSSVVASETRERAHLLAMPETYGHLKERTFEECECIGCKDQVDKCHCDMKPCAEKKGLLSCADCTDFPCRAINDFGHDGAPHHAGALRNLWRIKEAGYDQWLLEMESMMYCKCGTRQSWYYRCPVHTVLKKV